MRTGGERFSSSKFLETKQEDDDVNEIVATNADKPAGEGDPALKQAIIEALREIYDPEIPVNIYELGLIYGVDIDDDLHVR